MLYIKAQLQEILNHFSSREPSPALSSQAAIVFLFEFLSATVQVASRRGREAAKFRCCSGVPRRSSRVSGRLSETKQHLLFFGDFFHTNSFFGGAMETAQTRLCCQCNAPSLKWCEDNSHFTCFHACCRSELLPFAFSCFEVNSALPSPPSSPATSVAFTWWPCAAIHQGRVAHVCGALNESALEPRRFLLPSRFFSNYHPFPESN